MSAYIYAIENLINHKKYIGQTKDPKRRKTSHFSKLRHNKHINNHLQNAWNKYGESNFRFNILLQCEDEEANYLEEKLIEKMGDYNSDKKVGYYDNSEKTNLLRSQSHLGLQSGARKLEEEQVFEILSILSFVDNAQRPLSKIFGISKQPIKSLLERKTYNEITLEYDELSFNEQLNIFKQTIYKLEFNPYLIKNGSSCPILWNSWRVYKEKTLLSYTQMSNLFYKTSDMIQKAVKRVNNEKITCNYTDEQLWKIANVIINNNTVLSLEKEKCND